MLGCIIPGVPLGFLLGYTRFPGRNMLRILVDTALSFPTVVLGLLVYLLLARQGPFADFELLFTVPGIAIGLALLGLPIVIAHTCLAVEQADRLLAPTLRTLGAGPWQLLFSTVRELRFHLLTACITAFGRVVSEVGISMLVGGNIKWATRTITTAITLETGKGDYARSIALGIVLVTLAGLYVDGNGAVLDQSFEPIPGLYVSGNDCGRRFGYEYITPIPGCSLGMAIVLGRECGKSVGTFLG